MNILSAFTPLYSMLSSLDRTVTSPVDLPHPVISVGNITWGGTGKTPMVIRVAEECLKYNKLPAILSRGYHRGSMSSQPVIVSDGAMVRGSVRRAGDEPYMMAHRVPRAIVMVGANRVKAAQVAEAQFHPDIYILDDGFQHWKIQRSLDIVCVNALNPFGNGSLIPAGILREPLDALARAGIIIITSSDLVDEESLNETRTMIARYSTTPQVLASYQISSLIRIVDGEKVSLDELSRGPIVPLSALGNNHGFWAMLSNAGLTLGDPVVFRDHHDYTVHDISTLARQTGNTPVITTEKDAVKIKTHLHALEEQTARRFFKLSVEVVFNEGEDIWDEKVKKLLRSS